MVWGNLMALVIENSQRECSLADVLLKLSCVGLIVVRVSLHCFKLWGCSLMFSVKRAVIWLKKFLTRKFGRVVGKIEYHCI